MIPTLRFEVSSCAVGAVSNAAKSGCYLGRSVLTGVPRHRHRYSGSSQCRPISLWNHPACNGPRGDIASFRAAQRSSSFGRTFWGLVCSAVALWCVGQILATYIGDILHIPSLSIPVVNIFFYSWPAPLFMCLFLDPAAEGGDRLDWERFLDFAQVVLAFVLLDIYLSDLPLKATISAHYISRL